MVILLEKNKEYMSDVESKQSFIGNVLWFSNARGYGFISWNKENIMQKDLFVYWSDIAMEGFKTLLPGQTVSFEIGLNHKSQPKAINVKIVTN